MAELERYRELVAAHEQVLALFAAWARSRKTGALQIATKRLNIVPAGEDGRAAIERLEQARRALAEDPRLHKWGRASRGEPMRCVVCHVPYASAAGALPCSGPAEDRRHMIDGTIEVSGDQ